MDISTFRWILIIAGIAIVAYIFLFANPGRKQKPRASRKRNRVTRTRREPTLEAVDPAEDVDDEEDTGQAELPMEPAEPEEPPKPLGPPPDKIVTLFLQARDNHRISGVDLLDAAVKSGLVFGEHDIFHRVMDDSGEVVFSMANLEKPGQFDKTAWNTMETRGVTMFMTLPGPMGALDAWDAMLATSRRIAELLHCDLLDESRSHFTRQREGQIREELREYERSKRPVS
ncbi:MAG: cell division protein ZipA [Xanthomonadales bacterium]|nr:cell division protein ZipA [Xanthomonadales bacterium]